MQAAFTFKPRSRGVSRNAVPASALTFIVSKFGAAAIAWLSSR